MARKAVKKPVKKITRKTSIHKRAISIKKKSLKTPKITKTTFPKKVIIKSVAKPLTKPKAVVEQKLADNFVALQKVMVNLSLKFDNLANQISKLIGLFEISARSLAKKDFDFGVEDAKEIKDKIDNLFEQNKVIARGLTLMHEKIASRQAPPLKPVRVPVQRRVRVQGPVQAPGRRIKPVKAETFPKPEMPPRPGAPPKQEIPPGPSMEGYEKSISSQPEEPKKLKE